MNLLAHLAPADDDTWKRDFDATAVQRMQAGMTVLQLWRQADGPGVTALFEVNDRKKAQAWFDRETATSPAIEANFLRTA
ncbi:DUF3303 family protein [Jannaschia sp. M317]|uniref:DUF3303 family protein n=1 Tax=Jannaschia sp. M317 TaxID=2867011 RepID=UPI0021A7B9AE|nr:DUF3303 family protein [Jannaschia sp. M317]UWQ18034.1 hypothetical protein K3551_01630 [Jannaschia sp. M317]